MRKLGERLRGHGQLLRDGEHQGLVLAVCGSSCQYGREGGVLGEETTRSRHPEGGQHWLARLLGCGEDWSTGKSICNQVLLSRAPLHRERVVGQVLPEPAQAYVGQLVHDFIENPDQRLVVGDHGKARAASQVVPALVYSPLDCHALQLDDSIVALCGRQGSRQARD